MTLIKTVDSDAAWKNEDSDQMTSKEAKLAEMDLHWFCCATSAASA